MTISIHIIDDEVEIADFIKEVLEKENRPIFKYNSAEEFLSKSIIEHGVFLVDWNLPGEQGTDVVKNIRKKDKISPIIMLSGNDTQEHVFEGLSSGADDYLTKPFNHKELKQRVSNACFKLEHILKDDEDKITLLPDASSFIRGKKTIKLTTREYIIFSHLYNNSHRTSSREEILKEFSTEKDFNMTVRNIDVHVFSLRKKLKKADMAVETVWSKGYILKVNNL